MSEPFSFRLIATDAAARCGEFITPHCTVATPAFMPVGTQATVKGLAPESVRATGAEIVLANTYHLMLRPGAERIAALGGLHKFMNWPYPILTDSGGFQVMSLSELRKIEERCVTFRSHLDGAMVELSPERAVEIQTLLGSDIAMQLDECIKLPAPRARPRSRTAAAPVTAMRCSVSCRAATIRNCGSRARAA
jgi:queuine tRNA-ribosyltransferase